MPSCAITKIRSLKEGPLEIETALNSVLLIIQRFQKGDMYLPPKRSFGDTRKFYLQSKNDHHWNGSAHDPFAKGFPIPTDDVTWCPCLGGQNLS